MPNRYQYSIVALSVSVVSAVLLVACAGDDAAPKVDAGADAQSDAMSQTCDTDSECDDGVFCNGEEFCNDNRVCERGQAMDCNDDIECTLDRCVEQARACRNIPADVDGDGHPDRECVDSNGDPFGDDCDDNDPTRFPGNVEICDPDHHDEDCDDTTFGGRDQDGDGHEDMACCNYVADMAAVALRCGDDCDDLKFTVNPDASEVCDRLDNDCDTNVDEGTTVALYVDADRDGHGAPSDTPIMACAGTVGLSNVDDDCDDDDVTVHGAQVEICDGVDNDCDLIVDESPVAVNWYLDADGDGFGSGDPLVSCQPLAGRSILNTDCDDSNAMINPRAVELCDGLDNDCNGAADYYVAVNDFEDDDGDGVADAACGGTDCDDQDPNTAEGAEEICDGLDNDCDGAVDENAPTTVWYIDRDRDGYGDSRSPASAACFPIPGRTPRPGDCDDGDSSRYPTAPEICDGLDNDCDRVVDEDCVDPPMGGGAGGSGGAGGAGGSGGTGLGGSGGVGGGMVDAGLLPDASTGLDASVMLDAGTDGQVDPWPPIVCDETTALDGTDNVVSLTVADQVERVPFCGVFGQRVGIETTRSGSGCFDVELRDIEDNVFVDRLSCGTSYQEHVLPGDRPYLAGISTATVPQNGTIRIWDIPVLPTQAFVPDGTAHSQTTAVGQRARWTFDVAAGQRVTLNATGPGCRQITVRGLTTGTVVHNALACGAYILDNFTFATTETYEVLSDPSGTAVGQHQLTGWVLGADAMLGGAIGGSVMVPITLPGNNGSTTFTGTAGQRISITATNIGCTTFTLTSPTNVSLFDGLSCGAWFSDVLTLTETGTYRLAINPSGLGVGVSTVTIYELAPDPVVAVPLDGSNTVSILVPGNNGSATFSATAGQRISITATNVGCNTITFTSPTAVSLHDALSCGAWFSEVRTLTETGVYTVGIDPNGTAVGTSTVTIHVLATDPTYAAALDGVPVGGNVDKPGNINIFEFTGATSQRISIRGQAVGCTDYSLVDMANTTLTTSFQCGEWFLENFVLPATQTYTVVIDPSGTSVGNTRVILHDMPPDIMGSTSINGGAVMDTTTTPGQNARFTFSGTSGQSVTFQATGPGCTNYSLTNPGAASVFGPTLACGTFNRESVMLTQTGTYTFLINPSGVSVGNVSLNVTSP